MAAFNKIDQYTTHLATGIHNFNSHTLKVALSNTAAATSMTLLSDISEISAGNGYTAGGNTAAFLSGAGTAGVYKLTLDDVLFTASGGSIASFRYAWLYNASPTSPLKPLIGFWDYGSVMTLTNGNGFLVDLNQVTGALTIT